MSEQEAKNLGGRPRKYLDIDATSERSLLEPKKENKAQKPNNRKKYYDANRERILRNCAIDYQKNRQVKKQKVLDRYHQKKQAQAQEQTQIKPQYQIVQDPPIGWEPFQRQKPQILFSLDDPNVIYVTSMNLFGTIVEPVQSQTQLTETEIEAFLLKLDSQVEDNGSKIF